MPSNQFRSGYVALGDDGAVLHFASTSEGRWTLHYEPADEAVRIATATRRDFLAPLTPMLIAEGDTTTDAVVTRPFNPVASSRYFLEPRYHQIGTVTLKGFGFRHVESEDDAVMCFDRLPAGFNKSPFLGLGINHDLRALVEAVAEIDEVTDLTVYKGRRSGPIIEGTSYVISAKAFDEARRAVRRIHSKALELASEEKDSFAHNTLLTSADAARFPAIDKTYRKNAIVEAIGASVARSLALSTADRKLVVFAAESSVLEVQKKEPEALLALSRKIEAVTLDELIGKVKSMIGKSLKEGDWQEFFIANPFILRLAFGIPIAMFGEQVSVGGTRFSGTGGKISDFAVKAAASGNLSLIEIKTPDTQLLENTAYRGQLYAPYRELSGAVNQVLDQRYQLSRSISVLKDTSGEWDIESYAINGLVIAGRSPSEPAKLKSLELFRNGLKSITVITFDELLTKLEHLAEVFASNGAPVTSSDATAPAAGEIEASGTSGEITNDTPTATPI